MVWVRCGGGVGGGKCGGEIKESSMVVLWHVGALVSVKQGARVGDCRGV